jgi:LuxR family maltose regulon positive regulatory protein
MAYARPRVAGQWLHVTDGEVPPIPVGSPAWFAWLEANRTFEYAGDAGAYVALKERSGRAGTFWRAFRRQDGVTRRAYLGQSRDLTLERLQAAARALAGEVTVPAADPNGGDRRLRLGAPPVRRGHVTRERLLDRLRDEDEPLTLVVAPAGYGKTALLAQWIATDARRAAWLALEPADDDPRRFWAGVLDGLDALVPGCAARARALLPSVPAAGATAHLPALLGDLAARLAPDERGRPMVLTLDDYHQIADPRVHEAVAALVERLPPGLRLVISGRESPPLPIPRLRARGQLLELRAADLAFTADETGRFLRETMGLALDAEVAAALAERTEGWAAGLQIAALGLRDRADPAGFVDAFHGSHRHVLDFLVDEVIARQPAEVRRFLRRTAVLDRLCAPLCDALLAAGDDDVGDEDGAGAADARDAPPASRALLERLEAGGLFIMSLDDDRVWFRYHHLFAEVLLHRLRAEAPGLEQALRRRAAAWCEAAGQPDEAIKQALAGEDWERVAQLIEKLADSLVRRGDFATLDRWLAALPADLSRSRPGLALARAAIAYASRDYARLPRLVGELEASLNRAGDVEMGSGDAARGVVLRARAAVLGAMVANVRGDSERAETLTRRALANLPANDAQWRAFMLLQSTYLAHFSGDLIAAGTHAAEGLALAGVAGDHLLVIVLLLEQAHILHDRGRLTAAEAHLERARGVVERLGALAFPEAAALDLVAALVRYDRNDLAGAERRLGAYRELSEVEGRPLLGFWAGSILARIRAARGDFDGAYGALDEAEQSYQRVAPALGARAKWTALVVPAWRARLDAERGDLSAVRAWADEVAARVDIAETPLGYWAHGPIPPMLARAQLLNGDPAGALDLLAELRVRAEAGGAGRALLVLLALEALALETLGRREAAAETLARALALAAPDGAVRPVLDEGAPMADLARRVAGRGGTDAAGARALLAAFGAGPAAREAAPAGSPGAALVEPLTERELEVLGLVAGGLSNEGIAERIFLSASTVKWHLRAIYGKLGAERRTDAVARARALGLLD